MTFNTGKPCPLEDVIFVLKHIICCYVADRGVPVLEPIDKR